MYHMVPREPFASWMLPLFILSAMASSSSDPAFGETVMLRLGAQPTLEQSYSTIFRACAGLPSQTQALNMYSRELRS